MRSVPLLLMFLLGAAAGIVIGRMTAEEPVPPVAEAAPAAPGAGELARDAGTVTFDIPSSGPPADASRAQDPVSVQRSAAAAPPRPVYAEPADPADANVQRIDAGPVFNQHFANAEKMGGQDSVLQAHRALEREPRDDSWSYPLEAEIENSLVPDTSMGNFRRDHVECRSTMCEIRLSAEGAAQIEALRQWTSDIQKFPWAARMLLSSASSVVDDSRMDALLIVRKPPPPPESD